MEDDIEEKDDSKRKSRNLSEKRRRDQFNLLVNELSSMVSSTNRKMDKSTVLKSTINFLKHQNEISTRSRVHEIQENWKPAFLPNEEFTHLVLEAIDGYILVFSTNGRIVYASESITSLLGYLPNDLLNMSIYDLAYDEDHTDLHNLLLNPTIITDSFNEGLTSGKELDSQNTIFPSTENISYMSDIDPKILFIGICRIKIPQLIREMSIISITKSEFTSRHSLEWKYLFLDHRAPQIIGYLPFEVLGTSGYDYYHFDDLEKVALSHEALKQKGEGTSCYYRFLTKGQQWIWLQTRYYITYHQWNSKPEFVVCTHRVISHADVMHHLRNNSSNPSHSESNFSNCKQTSYASNVPWNSRSLRTRTADTSTTSANKRRHRHHNYHGAGSDSTSMSADSVISKHSDMTQYSTGSRATKYVQQPMRISPPQHQSSISSPQLPYITHIRPLQTPQILTPAFIEPPQYFAAIPVQPVIEPTTLQGTSMQPPAELIHPNVVMTLTQSLLQDELQRKHEELQQLIVHQQDELRRVSEQLLMARYGLPIVNSPLPNTSSLSPVRNINANTNLSHHNHHHLHHHQPQQPQPHNLQILSIDSNDNRQQNQPHLTNEPIITIEQADDQLISYMHLSNVNAIQMDQHSHLMQIEHQDVMSHITTAAQSVASDLETMPYDIASITDQSQYIFDPGTITSQAQ